MKPRIIRSAESKVDLRSIASHIGPFPGKRFLAAAERALQRLAELAGIHETENPRLAGIRVWAIPKFENYLIFYKPIDNGISLIRVLHGARDLERVLGQ